MLYKWLLRNKSKTHALSLLTMSAFSPVLIILYVDHGNSFLASRLASLQTASILLSKWVSVLKYQLLMALPSLNTFSGSLSSWLWWILCLILQLPHTSCPHWCPWGQTPPIHSVSWTYYFTPLFFPHVIPMSGILKNWCCLLVLIILSFHSFNY